MSKKSFIFKRPVCDLGKFASKAPTTCKNYDDLWMVKDQGQWSLYYVEAGTTPGADLHKEGFPLHIWSGRVQAFMIDQDNLQDAIEGHIRWA
jgi:hypothetical protein